jgi:hypothetical protein
MVQSFDFEMDPALVESSPVMIFNNVDLPRPFSPIRPILSFGRMNMDASS